MPDHTTNFAQPPQPGTARTALPLQGLTLLAVEDSRYASEALRLMCQRSGARLRRADCLRTARRHLQVYRPDAVIIDLGLPDGRGETLIAEILDQGNSRPMILAASGMPEGRTTALAAGADGFIDKPIESLAAFHAALLAILPDHPWGHIAALLTDETTRLVPDALALHDDLSRAAGLLSAGPDLQEKTYLAGFLTGIARGAHDKALERAAQDMMTTPTGPRRFKQLAGLIAARLDATNPAFTPR